MPPINFQRVYMMYLKAPIIYTKRATSNSRAHTQPCLTTCWFAFLSSAYVPVYFAGKTIGVLLLGAYYIYNVFCYTQLSSALYQYYHTPDPDIFSSGIGRWVSVTFLASTSVSNEVSQVRSTESDGRVSFTI